MPWHADVCLGYEDSSRVLNDDEDMIFELFNSGFWEGLQHTCADCFAYHDTTEEQR